jgi:Zn-dependent peptidase ImmA (M78 family)
MNLGLKADAAHSYLTIEKIALDVRRALFPRQALATAIPGLELFERLHLYSVGGTKLSYEVSVLPNGVEAKAEYDAARGVIVIVLSEETYAALEANDPRAKFTVFHEVGHALLHHGLLKKLAVLPHGTALNRAEAHPKYMDTEWQANAFAAAILMPASAIAEMPEWSPSRAVNVALRFGVSTKAAEVRLRVLQQHGGLSAIS